MKIFEQYYVGGSDGGQDTKDMQLYLFEGLKKYDSNKRISAVRNLIDLTINEIQLLYKRKEMFESKTGFVLAFVSIVFVAFLQSGIMEVLKYSISNINSTQNACWLLIIISAFVSLGFSVGFTVDVLYSKDIYGLSVKDRKYNYKNVIDDDPKRTLTKTGIQIRKVLYPIFRKIIPFTVRRKMVVISRGKVPKKEPIIFVSTHEFREDAEATYLAAGKAAFIVNGSVSIVMNSFDGITNWIVGMILVNRADKDSRKAVKNKMIYALRMGASIIFYPEGTWNKSPNQIISGLFPGVFEVARATGCPIVPMAHQREGELIYSKVGDAFDISGMSRYKAMETVKEQLSTLKYELMETCGQVKRKYLPVGIEAKNYWEEHINALMAEVPLYDYELEKHTKWVDKDVTAPTDVFSFFKKLQPSKYNAFLYRGNIQYMI